MYERCPAARRRARRLSVPGNGVDVPRPTRRSRRRHDGGAAARPEIRPGYRDTSSPELVGRRRRGPRFARVGSPLSNAALLAAAAAASSAVLLLGDGNAGAASQNDVAAIAISGDRPITYTDVGTTPDALAFGVGGVWTLNADDRTITPIDPLTRRVVQTFATGSLPTGLTAGAGAVWVGSSAAQRAVIETGAQTAVLSRIDEDSTEVTSRARLPGSSSGYLGRVPGLPGVAVGEGAVWAIDPDGSIARVDPASGSASRMFPLQGRRRSRQAMPASGS